MARHRLAAVLAMTLGSLASAASAQDAGAVANGAAAAPAAVPLVPPPPAAAFARLPFIENPVLSPDGTRFAARVAIQGKLRFAIVPIDERAGKIALIDPGDYDLRNWQWVNDQWLVVRAGKMAPIGDDKWYVRRAFAVSADGKKINVLETGDTGQVGDDILWVARDGRPHVLVAQQRSIYSDDIGFWPEVRDYDVSTGKSVIAQSSMVSVMDWYADAAGVVRLGIAYNDDRRSYRALYRTAAGAPFRTIDRAGRGQTLGTLPALIMPQSGKAIAVDDGGDGFAAIYDFDLDTMKIGAKLFGLPQYDVNDTILDSTGTRVIGYRYTDTRPRTKWIDPALVTIQDEMDKAIPQRWPTIVSWNRDLSFLLIRNGAADSAGAFYYYRPSEGKMSLLAQVNPDLGLRRYGPVKTVRYAARDGTEMSGVLTLPRGREAKNLPLILMPHGGPFARDDEEWDWWAQFLASRGYAVLQPNYRGSSGYGTKFAKLGEGEWGLKMQDDLADAVGWATHEGIADAKRVCIVGASYGGYAALRAAQRDKQIYRCAVSFAGVSDMTAMMRYDRSFLNGGGTTDWLRKQAPDLKTVSPINFAGSFAIPVLIVHGKVDQVVPVKQSREMAERLKAVGATYRYVEQPLGDHHFTREADRLQFLEELETFLTKYNPA